MPPGDPRIRPLADHVLAWLEGHRRGLTTGPVMIGTLVRAHATQDGFALAAFCLLGMARSHRVRRLAERIDDSFLKLRFPPYWYYDVLQGLWVLSRAGALKDGRAGEGIDLVAQKRRPDGKWRAGGYHWNPPGARYHGDVVDWGRGGPSEWVTLRALRVLKAAGLLEER
jgi:hypothetical protein